MKQKILKKLEEKKKKGGNEKKISRQGISAEVFGKYNEKKAFVAKVIKKSEDAEGKIRALIDKSILFTALNEEDKQIIIDAMEEIDIVKGHQVIK